MRLMTWVLGVMVLLAWHDALTAAGRGKDGWWIAYVIMWVFVGAGALLTGVVRLVAGKWRAGAFGTQVPERRDAPAAHKGE